MIRKSKLSILIICLLMIVGISGVFASSFNTVLVDDFNRNDASNIGNSWIENNEGSSCDAIIENNVLKLEDTSNSGRIFIEKVINTSDVIEFKVKVDRKEEYWFRILDSSNNPLINFRFDDDGTIDNNQENTGYFYTINEWHNITFFNVNYTSGKFSVYYDNELVLKDGDMVNIGNPDKIEFFGTRTSKKGVMYIDDIVVKTEINENVELSNLTNGLVAYYNFEGNANDLSGNGHDGIVNGATLTEGKVGNAYEFDGYSTLDRISLGNDINPTNMQSATFSVWIKPRGIPRSGGDGHHYTILGQGSGTGSSLRYPFWIYIPSNTDEIRFNRGSSIKTINANIQNDVWTNIVCVMNGTIGKIYINGELNYTGTFQDVGGTNYPFSIGNLGDTKTVYGNTFGGVLDEVGVWSRVLTEKEIANLYNLGEGMSYPFAVNGIEDNITIINDTNDNSTEVNDTEDLLSIKEANKIIKKVFNKKLKGKKIKSNVHIFTSDLLNHRQDLVFNKYILCGDYRFAIYYGNESTDVMNVGNKFNVFKTGYLAEKELRYELNTFINSILDMPKKGKYKCN